MDFFPKLKPLQQHALVLFVILILPVILFNQTSVGGKRFLGSDTVQWRAMAEAGIEYTERTGEPALWTPNMFAGMPTYTISAIKVVPHIDTMLSTVLSSIFPAFWFWILMGGIYLLLIQMKLNKLSALAGSVIFGLTTYIPVFVAAGHNSKLITLAFIPWVILGYWMTMHHKKKLAGLVLFSIALTLEFRAGHPQITYYFVYLLFALWIFDGIRAYKGKAIKDWGVATGLLSIGTILGLTGNAGHYWRLAEYSSLSIRGGSALSTATTGGLDTGYAFNWSQGIAETLTFFIPNLFGGASPDYWGDKAFTSGPHYLGAIILPLILLALIKNRKPIVLLFSGVGLLSVFFAWGSNLLWFNELAFNVLPFFNKFRVPETWLILSAFCFMVTAVYGLDWLVEQVKAKKGLKLMDFALPFGLALVFGIVVFAGSDSLFSYTKSGEQQQIAQQIAAQNNLPPQNPQVQARARQYVNQELVPGRAEKTKSDALRFVLILSAATALVYFFFRGQLSYSVFMSLVILLIAGDLILVDKRYTAEAQRVDEEIDLSQAIERQKSQADEFVMENNGSDQAYPYRTLNLERNTFNSATASYFYPTVGGYNGAKLSIFQDLLDENALFPGGNNLNFKLLGSLNTRFIIARAGFQAPQLNPVFSAGGISVYENMEVLPKAFFVDSLVYAESNREAYNEISKAGFEPATYAVVQSSDELPASADSTASAEVTVYDNHTIEIQSSRSTDGFLVIGEIYYPKGWKAYLDGEEIAIIKTNYALRGVEVPAGDHTLRMEFKPDSFVIGSKIDWASNLIQFGLLGFLIVSLVRNRSSSEDEDSPQDEA